VGRLSKREAITPAWCRALAAAIVEPYVPLYERMHPKVLRRQLRAAFRWFEGVTSRSRSQAFRYWRAAVRRALACEGILTIQDRRQLDLFVA
jgi:hypothetical protein